MLSGVKLIQYKYSLTLQVWSGNSWLLARVVIVLPWAVDGSFDRTPRSRPAHSPARRRPFSQPSRRVFFAPHRFHGGGGLCGSRIELHKRFKSAPEVCCLVLLGLASSYIEGTEQLSKHATTGDLRRSRPSVCTNTCV